MPIAESASVALLAAVAALSLTALQATTAAPRRGFIRSSGRTGRERRRCRKSESTPSVARFSCCPYYLFPQGLTDQEANSSWRLPGRGGNSTSPRTRRQGLDPAAPFLPFSSAAPSGAMWAR